MSYNIHIVSTNNEDKTFRFNSPELQELGVKILSDVTNKTALLYVGHEDNSIKETCVYKIKEKDKSKFSVDANFPYDTADKLMAK